MPEHTLSARPMEPGDLENIANYWISADEAFLQGMGADIRKIPSREDWLSMLGEQLTQGFEEKRSYCTIWELDGQPIGHCNVNKIVYGGEAYMHLHVWNADARLKGFGTAMVKLSLPYFFNDLQLKCLYCEPYALNPAPNKTLEKVGFRLVKEYVTIPGYLNFEQPVKRWELSRERYDTIINENK